MPPRRRAACLLLHGFGSSTFEMEPLVAPLEALGCTVHLELLPGHGGTVAEFRNTYFPDWLAAAEERYAQLAAAHERVIPIGFSMGGSLALMLAAKYSPAGAVCLAPGYKRRLWPLNRRNLFLLALPVLQYLRPQIPLAPPKPESRAIAPYEGIDRCLCLPQIRSLVKALNNLPTVLPRVRCPLYILYDMNDATCPAEDGIAIARAVASEQVVLRHTRIREQVTSRHMLTTHRETKEFTAAEVTSFVSSFVKE